MTGRAVLATALWALLLPATSLAAGTAYVANVGIPGEVRGFDYGSAGLLTAMAPPSIGIPGGSALVAVSPDGRDMWVTGANGSIAAYALSPAGIPSAKAVPTVATDGASFGATASPDGRSLYVTNGTPTNSINQYDLAADGSVTPKSPPSVPTARPASRLLALTPDGRHAYLTHGQAQGGIEQFDVDGAGRLTPKDPGIVGGPPFSLSLALTPDGRNLYVPSKQESLIYQYDIGQDGALSPKVPATVPSFNPESVVISADGRNAYSGNIGVIEQWDVGSGGVLVAKSPPWVAAPDRGASGMAVTPDGRSLYVNAGQDGADPTLTYQFDIDPDGKLAQKTPATVQTSNDFNKPSRGLAVRPMQGPTAAFGADGGVAASDTSFDASESRDPNGGLISRYDWNFGDGSSAPDAGATPTHVYGAAGTYSVTLHVTGAGGCNATVFTGLATICNGAPATRTRNVTVGSAPTASAGGAGGSTTVPVKAGFTIASRKALSKGRVQLTLRPSVPGKFAATATTRRGRKRVTYGKGKATARTAGEVKLTIKPGAAGRAALRRTRSLRLSIKLAFTPASNTTPSGSTSATVRGTGRR